MPHVFGLLLQDETHLAREKARVDAEYYNAIKAAESNQVRRLDLSLQPGRLSLT